MTDHAGATGATRATGADVDIAQLGELIGKERVSPWREVTQDMIAQFAEITGDRQWIHVDAERARRESAYGGTIAHGFLTLSLLSRMAADAILRPDGIRMGVNYGFEKVRFIAPVRSGKRVRGRFVLAAFEEKRPGRYQFTHNVTVEIEGEDKPALVADWIGLIFT
jgi:acyl dehydratase